MILTVDIGNTTICAGGLEKDGRGEYAVRFTVRMDTVPGRSWESYLAELRELLADAGIRAGAFRGSVLSSVVPVLEEPLRECVRILTGTEPVIVTVRSDTGLTVDLPEPNRIGRDRLVDAAWAAARFPLPAVTVDMGTATTFNVVDTGRVLRGGVIAPGVATGLRALTDRAAQLSAVELETPRRVIGRTTEECIRSGAVAGAAAMVDGITARIEAELGKPVTLVMTGGLARYVEPLCAHPHIYDPDALLKGLALLYERNSGGICK
ncbi:MAG: type III pantothenate kinase [Clostridiales bacterium]|nr:type III pantothenate kinase [Clostridiales bacterium]